MSERFTSVNGPVGNGVALRGRHTRQEMIDEYRRHHQHQLEMAQAALATSDHELVVKTYVGVYARRNLKEVTE